MSLKPSVVALFLINVHLNWLATPTTSSTTCESNSEFQCRYTSKCIRATYVCDGEDDCNDGSDEDECTPTPCTGFSCDDGVHCLGTYSLCDGYSDCWDQSDESDCDTCSTGFLCGDRRCIAEYARCDGHDDCDTDEIDCSHPWSLGVIVSISVSSTIIVMFLFVTAAVCVCVKVKDREASRQQPLPTFTTPSSIGYAPGGSNPVAFAPPPPMMTYPPPPQSQPVEKSEPDDNSSENASEDAQLLDN